MLYLRVQLLTVGLLGLSHSFANAEDFSETATISAFQAVIGTEQEKICNPYFDEGCHKLPPEKPKGCTDCAPAKVYDFYIRDGELSIATPSIVNQDTLDALKGLGNGGSPTSRLPAQIGN